MDELIQVILPFLLIVARVAGCLAVMPLFNWKMIPKTVLIGMSLAISYLLFRSLPSAGLAGLPDHWLAGALLVIKETFCGLAIGLAAQLVFLAAQQAGRIISMQMGLREAGIIDPSSGSGSESMTMFFNITFSLLFLVAGGHYLLIAMIYRSYDVFPIAGVPELGQFAPVLLSAGTTMLTFALKLAAPVLAAFFVLTVVLGVIARVMPEMNVLLLSLPLRVGLGFLMAAAMMPLLESFAVDIADWMQQFLVVT
ncbi:MAG: flagellar biosynthetic protein FliR [Phycisphaerae bacterium]